MFSRRRDTVGFGGKPIRGERGLHGPLPAAAAFALVRHPQVRDFTQPLLFYRIIGVTPFRYGFVGCLKHLNINGAPRDVVQLAHQQDVGKSQSCDGFWI